MRVRFQRRPWRRYLASLMCTLATATCAASPSFAQGVADFYRGRNIEMIVGWSAGAGYDVYARLLARHMGRLIPGTPAIVVQNMAGAGSLRATNYLYNVAARDGTVIGMIGRGTAFDPLLLPSQPTQFDAAKFGWLGSMNDEVSVCVAWGDPAVTTLQDATRNELVTGGAGPSSDMDQFAMLLNRYTGTRFKLISGYPGGNEINLAMQRGEVKGRCGWSWSSIRAQYDKQWRDKTFHVLVQLSLSKHPDLPDVPLVMDLARTAEDRQVFKLVFARQVMGRPFLTPPGLPAGRLEALRQAFADTMKDKEFVAEAEKMRVEINPVSGDRVQALVAELYSMSPEVARKAGQAIQ